MYMEHEPCNTSLALGLGTAANAAATLRRAHDLKPCLLFHILSPSTGANGEGREEEPGVGRRRTRSAAEEQDAAEKDAHQDGRGAAAKKKLRLTKEQSALLESSFGERSTLTPNRKQELADRLNLRPRQVEVWFQNRRARTKLKQTEVDCELLKKCCESLSDENRRLKEELRDLRSIRPGQLPASFSVHLPRAPTVAVCPSCGRVAAAADGKMAPGAAACDVVAAVGKPRRLYTVAPRRIRPWQQDRDR